ncbi:MAG: hypothetical protein ACQEXJ_00460 [Myxococcota bacterium]
MIGASPGRARVGLAVFVCAGALVLLAAPASASTEGPEYFTGWLEVRGGAALGMGIGGDLIEISQETRAAPAFGVGASWRLPSVDLGAVVEHVGGSHFTFRGDTLRMQGQVRAALNIRWRYIDGPWGGLYTRLSPGWSGMRLTPEVRDAMADEVEDATRGDVSGRASGFGFGFAVGLLLYPTSHLGFFMEFEGLATIARVEVGDERFPFNLNRSLFGVGVVWRP